MHRRPLSVPAIIIKNFSSIFDQKKRNSVFPSYTCIFRNVLIDLMCVTSKCNRNMVQ